MDISVIILCYNQENTISRTLDSILAQKTSCKYDVIISDDDSKDNTRTLCEDYQKRYPGIVKVLDYHSNYGVVKNYVTCLRYCTGKYIMECAGDDWWSNQDKMQIQYDYMESHPECVLLHGGYIEYFPATGIEVKKAPFICPKPQFEHLLSCCNICAPTVCIRKEAMNKIGAEEFVSEGFAVEDYPSWLGLALQGDIQSIDVPLVTYTQQMGSLHNCNDYERRITMLDNLRRIRYYMASKVPGNNSLNTIIDDSCYIDKATAAVLHNRRKDAMRFYMSIKIKNKQIFAKIIICCIPFLFCKFHKRYAHNF